MRLTVQRRWETTRSITGEMSIDGVFRFYTLEPARTNPVNVGHPVIPIGIYPVTITQSWHLRRRDENGNLRLYKTPELSGVPGRSEIRIHIGNRPEDTLGCTLVGMTHSTDLVGGSVHAFDALMAAIGDAQDLSIEYIDPV